MCKLWELASTRRHNIHALLSAEYMWKDLEEVEVRVLGSSRVDDEVKEVVRAAWIAAVVS